MQVTGFEWDVASLKKLLFNFLSESKIVQVQDREVQVQDRDTNVSLAWFIVFE